MEIGASSACFYPLETERSFLQIAQLGIKVSEIFFNSPSELSPSFVKELKAIQNEYDINVTSLHPYRSFSEGYDLFSVYKRRFADAKEEFKRYFEAANTLGAQYIVLHGSKFKIDIETQEYAERLFALQNIAKSFGCNVSHENVVNFSGEKPEFMSYLASQLKDDFKMVLDIKQARRAGIDPYDFIKAVGENIIHVHVSDFSKSKDCIPPSANGSFDFESFFYELLKIGYNGKYIVELYSDGFEALSDIPNSVDYLQTIYNKVRQGL